ncbi:MAG: hypothetical protein FJY07_13025, partial [Bacteroidetes bacterium]|nr:hypothetical protein [Bacteroidota bacterium]
MKRYLLKVTLFLSPVIVCAFLVILVDPYEFINVFHIISEKTKIEVLNRTDESSPRGNLLWKSLHYKRNPKSHIMIGDSQGKNIKSELIKELSGEDVFNYCVAGASFETLFEMFWFAAKQTQLEKVYFQFAFMNYNLDRTYNIFHFAQDYFDNPAKYFTTKEIYYDTFINLLYGLTKNPKLVANTYEFIPQSEINALAEYRLNLFFGNYIYPEKYFKELKRIKEYCDENNIEVVYIVLPTYIAVDEYLRNNNLWEMRETFMQQLRSLGTTIDLDVP